MILVAHDRWFLEAVTTAVLELDRGRSVYFPGKWHVWRREQAARAQHAARTAEREADEIARLERFVERFGAKATKAKQAQSKLKQIERIKANRVEVGSAARRTLGFEFLKPKRSGRVVDRGGGSRACRPATRCWSRVRRSRSSAASTSRSSGRTARGRRRCSRRSSAGATPAGGRVKLGHDVQPAYFSQHEVELDERGSVLDATMAATGLRRPDAQKLLGRFLFSGWEAHEKPVTALSGGERRRLTLALVVASGANLLVLDEPTNHLDLESREALEAALEAFPGTVLLVTHDRALLDAVSGRLLAVQDGRLVSYAGGWAEYLRRREAEPQPEPPAPRRREQPRPKRASRERPRGPTPVELVEREIARSEARVAELEQQLADDWTNVDLVAAHRAARDELEALLARWESLFEAAAQERRSEPAAGAAQPQNASKAGGSVGTATISCQRPSAPRVISSTWSMSSSRPRRDPRAR